MKSGLPLFAIYFFVKSNFIFSKKAMGFNTFWKFFIQTVDNGVIKYRLRNCYGINWYFIGCVLIYNQI